MLLSSVLSFVLYALAGTVFAGSPAAAFTDPSSIHLWTFVILTLVGAIAGNLRGIALSTLVTLMVPENGRAKANGLIGTVNGVAFLIASLFSGLIIGYLGMSWLLGIAVGLTLVVIAHMAALAIPDLNPQPGTDPTTAASDAADTKKLDLRGTIRAINLVPGLFALIFINTFNNFLGGVFMSLMDGYGLELVSVQVWGALFGVLSLGFIVGGLFVARRGLGKSPLRSLFIANTVAWTICVFFTVQASIGLLAVGMFIWLCLIPITEAAEQTILQKVVPPERQGRVFGFAQSVEQAASPVSAFLIGPIAQVVFIPFMTTGAGVQVLGSWFGAGVNRGIALVFILARLIGLVATVLAMRSNAYRVLSAAYRG